MAVSRSCLKDRRKLLVAAALLPVLEWAGAVGGQSRILTNLNLILASRMVATTEYARAQ